MLFSTVNTLGQSHQHFISAFAPIFLRQKSSNLNCKYKKAVHEMLVNLSPVVTFTNIIFRAALFQIFLRQKRIVTSNLKYINLFFGEICTCPILGLARSFLRFLFVCLRLWIRQELAYLVIIQVFQIICSRLRMTIL